MAWSSLQPQTLSLRQRTRARPPQSLTPTCLRPDQIRAANTARTSNEVACPHPPRRFPASAAKTPTSAAVRNPHSRRRWPAGSCMRGFRTPAGTRNPSPIRPLRTARAPLESCQSASRRPQRSPGKSIVDTSSVASGSGGRLPMGSSLPSRISIGKFHGPARPASLGPT